MRPHHWIILGIVAVIIFVYLNKHKIPGMNQTAPPIANGGLQP